MSFGGSSAIDLGNVGIPAGDFTIGVTVQLPSAYSNDFPILSISDAKPIASVLNGSGSLHLFYSNSNGVGSAAFLVCGIDDAGNPLTDRQGIVAGGLSAGTQSYFMTTTALASGGTDTVVRTVYVQRVNGVVSIWTVEPGQCARMHNLDLNQFSTTSGNYGNRVPFTSISPKRCLLGGLNSTPALTTVAGGKYQRFFRASVAGGLSAAQMEAIAQGSDPRDVCAFDPTQGDRLWMADSTVSPASGSTVPEVIAKGQGGVLIGNVTVAAAIVTPVVENVRAYNIVANRVIQAGRGGLALSGTYTGVDGTVEAQVVSYANPSTVIVPWALVGNAVNGVWLGSITEPPKALAAYRLQIRKKNSAGTVMVTTDLSTAPFYMGVTYNLIGQSLSEKMRGDGSIACYGAAAAYCMSWSIGKGDSGSIQPFKAIGWHGTSGGQGYGEANLSSILGATLNSPVGALCDAVSGSSLESWTGLGTDRQEWQKFIFSTNLNQPRYLCLQQGQGDTIDSYAQYYAVLAQFYQCLLGNVPGKQGLNYSDWKFCIVPCNNGNASGDNTDSIRKAQFDWATDQIAAGNTQVILGPGLTDTNLQDGVHATDDANGFGRFAERYAMMIAYAEGGIPNSGNGPKITSAVWDGATSLYVKVTHNGGKQLQAPFSTFHGYISGTSLYVTSADQGAVAPGMVIATGAAAGTTVTAAGTGSVYIAPTTYTGATNRATNLTPATVNTSQTVGSAGSPVQFTGYYPNLTGFSVGTSSTFGATIAISAATILNGDTVKLTLASTPSQPPAISYMGGYPGATYTPLPTDVLASNFSPLYDDTTPSLNPTLGLPVFFTSGLGTGGAVTNPNACIVATQTNGYAPALEALTISYNRFAGGAPAGTVIGYIQGQTAGSTLAYSDPNNYTAMSGTDVHGRALIVTTSTLAPGQFTGNVTVTETLAGVSGSPKANTISLNNVTSAALQSLSPSFNFSQVGQSAGAKFSQIKTATYGSTITLSPNDGRVVISTDAAGARWLTIGSTVPANGDANVTYTATETLAGTPNSGLTTAMTVEVSAVAYPPVHYLNLATATVNGAKTPSNAGSPGNESTSAQDVRYYADLTNWRFNGTLFTAGLNYVSLVSDGTAKMVINAIGSGALTETVTFSGIDIGAIAANGQRGLRIRSLVNITNAAITFIDGIVLAAYSAALYYSYDGTIWNQLGTTQAITPTPTGGAYTTGYQTPAVSSSGAYTGKVFSFTSENRLGTFYFNPDFTAQATTAAGGTFTDTSPAANVWTIAAPIT